MFNCLLVKIRYKFLIRKLPFPAVTNLNDDRMNKPPEIIDTPTHVVHDFPE